MLLARGHGRLGRVRVRDHGDIVDQDVDVLVRHESLNYVFPSCCHVDVIP